MSQCELFVKSLCKTKHLNYQKMVKKYPQAYNRGLVYIGESETSDK